VAVIGGAPTSVAAFVITGQPADNLDGAPARRDRLVTTEDFAALARPDPGTNVGRASSAAEYVPQFFDNGGADLHLVLVAEGEPLAEGLRLLDEVELGLLCLPGEGDPSRLREALAYAGERRAFLIVDPAVDDPDSVIEPARRLAETGSPNAAVFFPPLVLPDPATGGSLTCPAGPAVAGLFARSDGARGVWKAAAGTGALLMGAERPVVELDQTETQRLVTEAVNPIRAFPVTRPVVWGARTVHGADWLASDWKYIPVRRLALFIENSIDRGTQWAVFEPNDEPLWAKLRASVEKFLRDLFRSGAFPGSTPEEAFFVRCDRTTMTQDDLDAGRVNVHVGFAPLRPAEFVIIRIGINAAPATVGAGLDPGGPPGHGREAEPEVEPKHRRPTLWDRVRTRWARLLGSQ
jgi:Bacteriophage tail sheath protein